MSEKTAAATDLVFAGKRSRVVKRSIVLAGHKTSVSLEDEFWTAIKAIATAEKRTLSDLVTQIDTSRVNNNLSSAIRLHVLRHLQKGAAR